MEEVREPEVWKDIPGYEGLYQVSSWGNVKSVDRIVYYKNGRIDNLKERFLNQQITRKGYNRVTVCKKNKRVKYLVHVIVAKAFLSTEYISSYIVNHKDLNPLNNYYLNLEYVNYRENSTHYYKSKNTLTGLTGVSISGLNRVKPYKSQIRINGKSRYLGRFKTPEEGHEAYLNALKECGLENKYSNGNQSL